MIEIVTETRTGAPPGKVWSVLTDFERYAQWHPWMTIRGVAAPGASIECSLSVLGRGQIYSTDARIRDFQKRVQLSWVFGIRGVFVLEERFSIEQIETGATLWHSVMCRGLLALLLGRAMKKRIDHLLRSADYALMEHLRKQRLSSPTQAGRPSGKRHSKRRKGRRTR